MTFWAALVGFLYGGLGWFMGTVSGAEAIVLITAFTGLFGLRRALP